MKSWVLKVMALLGVFFIFLYGLIWLLTPTIARLYSSEILKLALSENSLVLSEGTSIRYNPFISHLTISDLTLNKGNDIDEAVLSIEQLDFKVSLYKLFTDQFHIAEFEINGLFLKVNIESDNIEIAGINLSNLSSSNSTALEPKVLKEDASALIIKMAQSNLYNTKIDINFNGEQHHLDISALTFEQLYADHQEQNVRVILDATFDNAPLTLNLNTQLNNGVGSITSYTDISDLDVSHLNKLLPDHMTSLTGRLSYKGEQKITLTEDSTSIAFTQFELITEQLTLTRGDVHVALAEQKLTSDDLHILLIKEMPAKIKANAVVKIENLSVTYQNKDQVLAHVEHLTLDHINFDTRDYKHLIKIKNINLFKGVVSDYIDNDTLPLLKFNKFTIDELMASEQGLSIKLATLSKLSIQAELDDNKALSNLIDFPRTEPEEIAEDATVELVAPEKATSNFHFKIAKFKLVDNGDIHFIDNSVVPVYKQHITVTKLVVGPFGNQQEIAKTLFEIVGNSDKYSNFSFSGFSQPYAAEPVHHITGTFKEINLPAISTYMKETLKYVFDSGHLDLSMNTTITDGNIEGEMGILIRGLELTAADDEINTISDHSAIPFSMALSMLEDRKGNVELDIPLSGKTSDPSFGVSGFIALLIKQATISAAQEYLIATFVPYANVISIARTAVDHLLKIRFNDLEFPAAQIILQPHHHPFLSEFAALMVNKPDVNITVCGISTAADIGKPAGSEISSDNDKNKLNAISLARMNAFKSYMVKTEKLSSSRLLLCTPQVDSAVDAKPRITFSN